MESRDHRARGHVVRVQFTGRNSSQILSAVELCCCTDGLLVGLTAATCPTSTPAALEKVQEEPTAATAP